VLSAAFNSQAQQHRYIEKPAAQPSVFSCDAFIAHSENKTDGTADIAEHRASPFVVGAGNTNT
jgi:hypothetical protein